MLNGYEFFPEHRRPPGKCGVYEEDIRVPFFVRGPGVQAGPVTNLTYSMVDVGTTIVSLAQADPGFELDGRIMNWGARYAKPSELGTPNFHIAEYWNSPLCTIAYRV